MTDASSLRALGGVIAMAALIFVMASSNGGSVVSNSSHIDSVFGKGDGDTPVATTPPSTEMPDRRTLETPTQAADPAAATSPKTTAAVSPETAAAAPVDAQATTAPADGETAPTATPGSLPAPSCAPDAPANVGLRPVAPVTVKSTVVFFLNRFYGHGACLSVATALHQGYDVKLMGMGSPHAGLKRPERMVQFAKEHIGALPADELLVISDCGDTMFVRGPDALFEHYRAVVRAKYGDDVGAPGGRRLEDFVIVSGENALWNMTVGEDRFFDRNATGEARLEWNAFPNTGIFVGYRDAIVKLFVDVFDLQNIRTHTTLGSELIDQFIFTALWGPLNLSKYVAIDHRGDISYSMFVNVPRLSWVAPGLMKFSMIPKCGGKSKFKWCSRPYALYQPERDPRTGAEPIVLHWNGWSKYREPHYVQCYHRSPAKGDWLYDVDNKT
eukprot:CAMPEP_0174863722 /NCGR_PEP_ID=MMETSP1114-20130205/56821_1 /TAXON_ID=312471 /ORGANISM="Neobodo designis, Strain CCAP 1951/1" /LENGTH=441 /DNA_ID=CAMNT_0016098797 /DNA_START=41 /DNA_END=1362 /DNA_ORIENTATION=+